MFLNFIYSTFIPYKFIKNKKIHTIYFGNLKGTKIKSQLIFGQLFNFYEKKLFNFISSLIVKNTDCINLGAHNGYSSLKLAKIIDINSSVFSYEASLDLYFDFCQTIKLNKIKNIKLFNYTIFYLKSNSKISQSDISGMIAKNYHKQNNNLVVNNFPERGSKGRGSGENIIKFGVKKKFSQILKEIKLIYNKFLFIDIEGFEEDIIDNESANIFDEFYLVVIEYHSNEILKKIIKKIIKPKKFKLCNSINKSQKDLVYKIISKGDNIGHIIFYNPQIIKNKF